MTTPTGSITYTDWPLIPNAPSIPITDIWTPAGQHACRMEHYIDTSPDFATALPLWKTRMQLLDADLPNYATIVIDSFSFLQDLAVKWHRLHDPLTAAGFEDPRQWYNHAKEDIQQEMLNRLTWLRTHNLVVIAHASEKTNEFGDDTVRTLDAIGKLAHRLGTAFGEVYHTRVTPVKDKDGLPTSTSRYSLQTDTDAQWGAMSLIGAPNGCDPTYEALWSGGATRKPIHVLVYGNFGTGKSRFAATWPQPILVIATDPFAKLIHYERLANGERNMRKRAGMSPHTSRPRLGDR